MLRTAESHTPMLLMFGFAISMIQYISQITTAAIRSMVMTFELLYPLIEANRMTTTLKRMVASISIPIDIPGR